MRCFLPSPESGATLEDDDLSEDVEEDADVVKDSDSSKGEKEEQDDGAPFIARRERQLSMN
jgi:hypothetical protein